MGCLAACFNSLKHTKSKKPRKYRNPPRNQTHQLFEALLQNEPEKEANVAEPTKLISELFRDEKEDGLTVSSRKKVTFDLEDKTYEECRTKEAAANSLVENNKKDKEESGEKGKDERETIQDSSESSFISYPLSHYRHHKCTSSNEEFEDTGISVAVDAVNLKANDGDEDRNDGHNHSPYEEESSESLFSLSIDSRKLVHSAHQLDLDDKEVTSPLRPNVKETNKLTRMRSSGRDRFQCAPSVSNPVKDISHLKIVEAEKYPSLKFKEKENINLETKYSSPLNKDPILKQPNMPDPKPGYDVAVDTSLSSWLVPSESKPSNSKSSPSSVGNSASQISGSSQSNEERKILGSLSLENIKQLSPSHSPDDMPTVGTVGSYWKHTGQKADTDSGSSKKGTSGKTNKSKHWKEGGLKLNSTHFRQG